MPYSFSESEWFYSHKGDSVSVGYLSVWFINDIYNGFKTI